MRLQSLWQVWPLVVLSHDTKEPIGRFWWCRDVHQRCCSFQRDACWPRIDPSQPSQRGQRIALHPQQRRVPRAVMVAGLARLFQKCLHRCGSQLLHLYQVKICQRNSCVTDHFVASELLVYSTKVAILQQCLSHQKPWQSLGLSR
jgi:hypothetical protein